MTYLAKQLLVYPMDTSSYDNKLAELRAEEVKKSAGRPKGPETAQFRLQVKSAHLEGIKNWFKFKYGYEQPDDYWIKAASTGKEGQEIPILSPDGHKEVNELKSQIKALLEDNEKLTTLVANQEAKIQRVARLTDNEKLILWIRKYDELKQVYDKRFGASEHSQV